MTTEHAYNTLRAYADDLNQRVKLKTEWVLRHPDHNTDDFRIDEGDWIDDPEGWNPEGRASSFDPNDLMPNTQDVITAEIFWSLMEVALTAYENLQTIATWQGKN